MENIIVMKRCLYLAQLAIGKTYPNPIVGSVITLSGKVIGEGYHPKAGMPHAEVYAVCSAKHYSLSKAHISVTLEPCSHYGKTPPCAEMIVQNHIPKVSIGVMDTHQKVNGKGIHVLEKNGVKVFHSELAEECRKVNKRFFTFHEKKRPYIVLKWAKSADGFMDKEGKPFAISNSLVQQFVHTLRAQENAIMIGKNTAINDNPSLTTRAIFGRNPIRIVVDRHLETPPDFQLYQSEVSTIFINEKKEERQGNLTFLKVAPDTEIPEILELLHTQNIQSILVEGGTRLLSEFLRFGLWDEAIIIENFHLFLEKGTISPELSQKPCQIKYFRDNIVRFYKNII